MHFLYFCLLVISVNGLLKPNAYEYKVNGTCGCLNCPTLDSDKLNVHLVPHTHDDVGWLKTVDQYFYGLKNEIQRASVQDILDSVVAALLENSERRFIYVETAFFWKWWQERNETIHETVRNLVYNGQLQIAGGAWSMNDEATTNYQCIIDQFTWGFRKLNDTLGACSRPKIGWQIDTFGHSRQMASLLAQFGFDGLFMARIDFRDKEKRLATKSAEMIWHGSDNLGTSSDIFTSVFYNHYSAPDGFCFDILCRDQFIDNKLSGGYNANYKTNDFINYVKNQAKSFNTNNIIVPMGTDFSYQKAGQYFDDIDKLIKAVNNASHEVNVLYSTPYYYIQALNAEDVKWPTKSDDFFPYVSDQHSYWTGYFTSRPNLKRFERIGNNFLQVTKQLASLSTLNKTQNLDLDPLREVMGVLQHHDAITGTEKQHVANDYAKMLNNAINFAKNITNYSLQKLSGLQYKFENCLLLNISQCHLTERSENFLVTIYNPMSTETDHYAKIPVSAEGYEVFDLKGNAVKHQHVPIFDLIEKIPGRESSAKFNLIFKAVVPALGYKMYQIKYNSNYSPSKYDENKTLSNIQLRFSSSGFLKNVSYKSGAEISLNQNFLYYLSDSGKRSSGAYLFLPEFRFPSIVSKNVSVTKYSGPLVTEYHQKFNSWVGQIIRVYHDKSYIEFQWIVGPIFTKYAYGRNIISRFTTNLNNDDTFYTDSNGREMIKRTRNYKLLYNEPTEFVASNYYPVTSKITIKDLEQNLQFSVINDRSQGGSSLKDGEIELMVHRKELYDDKLGVNEALNEVAFGKGLVATGTHYVILGSLENKNGPFVASIEKDLMQRNILGPLIFISNESHNNPIIQNIKHEFSGLKKQMPRNVQILTLEPWDSNSLLLRLEHVFEKTDDIKYSAPATINIQNLFSTFRITKVKEMTLGANQLLQEMKRLVWETTEDDKIANNIKRDMKQSTREITLQPMEIRTFIIQIQKL